MENCYFKSITQECTINLKSLNKEKFEADSVKESGSRIDRMNPRLFASCRALNAYFLRC